MTLSVCYSCRWCARERESVCEGKELRERESEREREMRERESARARESERVRERESSSARECETARATKSESARARESESESENVSFRWPKTQPQKCMAFTASHSSFFSFLFLQVANNEDAKCTAFTVSVDLHVSKGISTGISASDRAATLRALADPATTARDLTRPGHIFPLRAVEGGVLKRNGHTEATVDLARMAGLAPAGVLCEIVTEDCSEMMRAPELKIFAEKHKLVMTSIHDMILYRKETGK